VMGQEPGIGDQEVATTRTHDRTLGPRPQVEAVRLRHLREQAMTVYEVAALDVLMLGILCRWRSHEASTLAGGPRSRSCRQQTQRRSPTGTPATWSLSVTQRG
jgi:hypothetical protein